MFWRVLVPTDIITYGYFHDVKGLLGEFTQYQQKSIYLIENEENV